MQYSEVIFTCKGGEPWHQDLLMQDLADNGFDTFEPRKDGFAGYIASEQLDLGGLASLLIHQPVGFEVTYEVKEILPQNWNKVWESNFEPVTVADKCHVRATFHPAKPAFPYEIVIDPKMAFGTGHHQTTSLMIRLLLETELSERSVLDMGCGTGILAILATKLGASLVWAIDNDPVCIASVEENKVLNETDSIVTYCGSVDRIDGQQFDVILANINRNILLEHLPYYSQSMHSGSLLYMSGFYEGEDLNVLKAAGLNYELVYESHHTLDRWVAAQFIKKG